jgi:hypothetical protein
VGAVIVQDEMYFQFRRNLGFELTKELDELLATMPRQATPDHFAVENIESANSVVVPCLL